MALADQEVARRAADGDRSVGEGGEQAIGQALVGRHARVGEVVEDQAAPTSVPPAVEVAAAYPWRGGWWPALTGEAHRSPRCGVEPAAAEMARDSQLLEQARGGLGRFRPQRRR